MEIKILRECGYEEAALGLSLSFNREVERMPEVMSKLYNKDGGHNKFLESIMVWIDMTMPRHFWQQFDTYRDPIDGNDGFLPTGMTKQSESTMHTILRDELTQSHFHSPIYEPTLARLNELRLAKNFHQLKDELPEGFLQRRIVCTNYKSLRNIVWQRSHHRNVGWAEFAEYIVNSVEHPEFFTDLKEKMK